MGRLRLKAEKETLHDPCCLAYLLACHIDAAKPMHIAPMGSCMFF
jgi:hypothetical protein